MSVIKRSVSIDDQVAARVEAAAQATAAEHQLLVRDGLRGVDAWQSEAGQLTPEERTAGEALLDRLLAGPRRPD